MRPLFSSLAVAMTLAASPVSAGNSAAYAQMAKATWSAFECSALAMKSKSVAEQERLFKFGYDQGQAFIAALQAGKIEQKDISETAPLMLLLLLQGPTPDFMLGRIFETAQDEVLKDVYYTGEEFNSEADQSSIAASKFSLKNCELIGAGK